MGVPSAILRAKPSAQERCYDVGVVGLNAQVGGGRGAELSLRTHREHHGHAATHLRAGKLDVCSGDALCVHGSSTF